MAEAALEEEDDSGPVSNSLNFFLSSMTVFVRFKPLQPSLIFAGKARN
jgi:hypothetical protein